MPKPKNIYLLKQGVRVFMVSSNIKCCYAGLKFYDGHYDPKNCRTYMQVTRIIKKVGYYDVPTFLGAPIQIIRFPVYVKFEVKNLAKNLTD